MAAAQRRYAEGRRATLRKLRVVPSIVEGRSA